MKSKNKQKNYTYFDRNKLENTGFFCKGSIIEHILILKGKTQYKR